MSALAFVERILRGRGAKARIAQIEDQISAEKARIRDTSTQLRGEIRQHAQIVETSSRLMRTMTAAMVMMEAKGGRDN